MYISKGIVVGLAAALMACSHSRTVGDGALTPSMLHGAPAVYDGQRVTVRGYAIVTSDSQVMFESEALYREAQENWAADGSEFNPRRYLKYCITIVDDGRLLDRAERINGRTLSITGMFRATYMKGRVSYRSCALEGAIVLDDSEIQRIIGGR